MLTRFLAATSALFVAVPLMLTPVASLAQETALTNDTTLNRDTTFKKEELDQILAPIALYPDDLLSNVLMASTYPLEVVQAARWIKDPTNARLKGDALTKALEKKDWAPSVKSLVPFPKVLEMMSEQLEWTQKLGDAFLASEADVMDRIQFLRDKADEAGHLKSNKHQKVARRYVDGSDYIYIEPTDPEVVYVPVYEPTVVYGSWWYPDYPPYYWPPPAGVVFVGGYYWGVGFDVVPPLWGWCSPWWGGHYIHINVHKYNRINFHRRKVKSKRWRHDAYHRRGVRYRNGKVRRRHAKHDIRQGRRKRLDYRDRDGRKGLNPRGNRRRGARLRSGEQARKFDGDGRKRAGRPKAGDRKFSKRRRASKRSGRNKKSLAGSKKRRSKAANIRRSSRAAKRSSRRAKNRRRIRAYSKSRRRASARRFSRRGRSSLGARRSGRRVGARRGGRRGGRGRRGGGRRR